METTNLNNVRREIGYKFRSAIGFDELGKKDEAYLNYLEGLSLVASTLMKDCVLSANFLSIGDKKALLNFAKQSVERLLIIILPKPEPPKGIDIHKNLEEILDMNSDTDNSISSFNNHTVKTNLNSTCEMPVVYEEIYTENVLSPLAELQNENKLLVAQYKKRIQSASTDSEKQNLQLELDRRLVENSAIAARRQVIWSRQRDKISSKFKELAQQKFGVIGEIKDADVRSMTHRKQETFAASLQYIMDDLHLNSLQQELSNDACNTSLSRSIVSYILSSSKHPVGNLMRVMQLEILKKIKLHTSEAGEGHADNFRSVADDIKRHLNVLESLLKAIHEPLSLDVHHTILIELLHYFYFGTLKKDLIPLLKLCTKESEERLEQKMLAKDNVDSLDLDEKIKNGAVVNLKQMMSHHSPCGMLAWLVTAMKSLAIENDLACNSLGADDLLPRLIEVVLCSKEASLPAHALFMETFLPTFKALGEEGYALTLFQSAIVCITSNER